MLAVTIQSWQSLSRGRSAPKGRGLQATGSPGRRIPSRLPLTKQMADKRSFLQLGLTIDQEDSFRALWGRGRIWVCMGLSHSAMATTPAYMGLRDVHGPQNKELRQP